MNKSAIKNYAVAARRKLIEAVRQKAFQLYVFEDGALPPDEAYHRLRADGIFLTPEKQKARLRLATELATLGDDLDNEKAYQHVIEEVAYTWFNRLIALRFMEVNDYLPSGIRILSSLDQGRIEPDAMREAERLDYVDQKMINELRAETGYDASEKLYKYILISQCNALSSILPGMFEELNDYTELLLPDALYTQGGIVHDLVTSIEEEDFREQVQIIGWLYQYYISEKKDEVFAGLKKNIKINKETIPAATQLFTPEWIVKYMVENSLGRLWLTYGPSGMACGNVGDTLREMWTYYIDEAEQDDEVEKRLQELAQQYTITDPTQVKIIDPCMGSGHILVYAFDVLFQIYFGQGYAESDITNLILQHNIYGLDIDGRAAQLAYFALMMKARSYNRRFFRQDSIPQPHVHAFIESDGAGQHHLDYMGHGMDEAERKQCIEDLLYLIDLFRDAREYGSILKIEKKLDHEKLRQFVKGVRLGQVDIYAGDVERISRILLEILNIAESMTQKHDVVVTNPPYMGSGGMGVKLSEYVKKNYPDSKSDLFAVFIERCYEMIKLNGYQAMITMESWMFLSSFEKIRDSLISNETIINLIHMPYLGKGGTSLGINFGTVIFVIEKYKIKYYKAQYSCIRYFETDINGVPLTFPTINERYQAISSSDFLSVPGAPIVYWLSRQSLYNFSTMEKAGEYIEPRIGLITGDNNRFLRLWYEIPNNKIDFNISSIEESVDSHCKWFPYHKGGDFKKWFGNIEYVVDWENDGYRMKYQNNIGKRVRSHNYNGDFSFIEGITWTSVTTGKFACRYSPKGFLFDAAGPICKIKKTTSISVLLAFLSSNVAQYYLKVINPTINFHPGYISAIPYASEAINNIKDNIEELANECIYLARTDWDSFETSWDFKVHPLIVFRGNYEEAEPLLVADDLVEGSVVIEWSKGSPPVSQAYDAWERFTDSQFRKLKANEEELNRIFIEIYGLQDELTPEVEDKDITIRKADLGRDIRSLISYAVGCMFGRYSLNEPGLIYAGGQFDMSRYKTFLPEDDNIIPISSADYFDDDIVVRFFDFIRTVYGESTLDENLDFIAEALYPNGSGTAKEKIRRYFLNDFYKDHKKTYKKRPIYWMLDSGKADGFKALFYLHRYDQYTIARVRTDYLHPLQRKYEAEISRLEMLADSTDSARERAAYRKEIETLQGKIEECRVYDQVVGHIAHQQIELDLDDGVKVNYAKFQEVEVPKGNGKIEKMDLLGEI